MPKSFYFEIIRGSGGKSVETKGKVYIIGVGPGDYKLLTLKAMECIEKADVLVYDRLVGSRILNFARRDAELVYVGKMPDHHEVPQHRINDILVEKALAGKTVARIKGGDPFVFGRGGEEAEALFDNGIEFEIVPGITSAISVPAYAGIPVTHRDFCSSLHIVTGHERPDKSQSSIDYKGLAAIGGTLVFLMGIKNLNEICSNLIKNGKNGKTPAAVIEKGTTSKQRVITGLLEDIAEKVAGAGIKPPAVTVIGNVVRLQDKLNWFSKGKLAGKRVIVTRSREQAGKLSSRIEELSGEAIEFPTIRIEMPESFEKMDAVIDHIRDFDWMVFTSINGVRVFFSRMKERRIDIRGLHGIKFCTVGEATAAELDSHGILADYIPESYTTADLLEGMLKITEPGEKILLARADIASPEITEGLKAYGCDVEDLVIYRTLPETKDRSSILELLEEGSIDYVTFTSSSTVRNLVGVLGSENIDKLRNVKILCIGPVTAKAAEECGLKVTAVADRYTIDGLVEKLVECSEKDRRY